MAPLLRRLGTEKTMATGAGLMAAAFYFREPAAGWIQHQHHPNPNRIDHRQAEAVVLWNVHGLFPKRTVEKPFRPAITEPCSQNGKRVNQRQVQ